MSIAKYLDDSGFKWFEGNCSTINEQMNDLITLTKEQNINVMQIGFNAGHSAEVFLKNNDSLTLTSFDIGLYKYVNVANKYIESIYPNRHTLILGDSLISVEKYISNNKDKKFDVIFIDGGHDYNVADSDLKNCAKLAHKDTIVILDDTYYLPDGADWTKGATRTWTEHISDKKIIELGRKQYEKNRGMSWGKYNFNSTSN